MLLSVGLKMPRKVRISVFSIFGLLTIIVDFEYVLKLESKNDAAQQEVKKVAQAILERNARMKKVCL